MKQSDIAVVVEKSQILRVGLIKILSESSYKTCRGFGGIDEINMAEIEQADNVLFLVNPGEDEQKVSDCVASLSEKHPNGRIVVFSHSYSDAHLAAALEGGAAAYLLTSIDCEQLVKSLDVIAVGGHVIPDQALKRLSACLKEPSADAEIESQSNLHLLSKREFQILTCLSQGMSNKLIARQWNITEATVKVHVKAILRKIKVKNRTEAACWAWDNGLNNYPKPTASRRVNYVDYKEGSPKILECAAR